MCWVCLQLVEDVTVASLFDGINKSSGAAALQHEVVYVSTAVRIHQENKASFRIAQQIKGGIPRRPARAIKRFP